MALLGLFFGLMPAAPHLLAGPAKIALPPETASFKPATGSALANGQCLTCHSVEYVLTQPPMPHTFWASEVKKMRQTYGASITDEQIEPLASYLSENYGVATNTQSVVAPGTVLKPVPATAQVLNVEALATKYGCLSCHNVTIKIVGPAYKDVAAKYRSDPAGLDKIIRQIHKGGSGKWGSVLMPPFPTLTDAEAKMLAVWIMRQGASK